MIARRLAAASALAALLAGLAAGDAWGHAALVGSDPAAGAELGASPDAIALTFSEQPEASISAVSVRDADGTAVETERADPVAGDPLSLGLAVPRLARGVYTVDYRAVSAVDGHATSGTFAFGVRASPSAVATVTSTDAPDTSTLEVIGRWLLLLGLVALVGGAVAGAARFGGDRGTDLALAAAGWAVAAGGLVVLIVAQRRTAGSSLGDLLGTSVGEALIWRCVALVAAGAGLLVARRRPAWRRGALLAGAGAGVTAMAVHVGAGHAAAGDWPHGLTIATQVAHFAAAGIWFGGLAALLLGIRGAPSAEKAVAVRRFAAAALAAFAVVLVTGVVRAVDELSAWDELIDTGYGRAVLAKVVLIGLIFVLAVRNRRLSLPASAADLGPLRRTAGAELVLATGALLVAALLGALAPPVTGQAAPATGLVASGADFATSVRIELTAASADPGPNRFLARITDYDSGAPVTAARVSLRFASLDDPATPPTTLQLRPDGEGSYAGEGANLSLDGRWRVTVLVESGAATVEVPLEIVLPFDEAPLSTLRLPGEAPEYTLQVENGLIRITADPERAGPSTLYVSLFGPFDNRQPVDDIVLTGAPGNEPAREIPARRLSGSRFAADVDLPGGSYTVTVVARTPDARRLRGSLELEIPD